jgi:hypothetical protein
MGRSHLEDGRKWKDNIKKNLIEVVMLDGWKGLRIMLSGGLWCW